MSQQWSVTGSGLLVAAVVAALVLLAAVQVSALVVSRRARRGAAREQARHEGDLHALRARVDRLERSLVRPAAESATSQLLITTAGEGVDATDERVVVPARVVPAPLFADLVLQESVVQAASWTAGVRRALSPEHRQRVRLEMRREVKRARKQRRAELRSVRRDWQAHQRAAQAVDRTGEGSAA